MIKITCTGLDDLRAKIANFPSVIDRTMKDEQLLKEIGTTLKASAVKTIDAGGRPLYQPLAQSTINRRWRKEQKKPVGKRANRQGIVSNAPLVDKGTLRQSLDYEVSGGSLLLTSVEYLKYHQFTENRKRANFPARPVWGVQAEDHDEITDIIIAGVERNL